MGKLYLLVLAAAGNVALITVGLSLLLLLLVIGAIVVVRRILWYRVHWVLRILNRFLVFVMKGFKGF